LVPVLCRPEHPRLQVPAIVGLPVAAAGDLVHCRAIDEIEQHAGQLPAGHRANVIDADWVPNHPLPLAVWPGGAAVITVMYLAVPEHSGDQGRTMPEVPGRCKKLCGCYA